MTTSELRRVRQHTANAGFLLISTLLILSLEFHPASAQQQYNNVSGYVCNGVASSCQAYALYRTQGTNSTLNTTASLFNTSAAAIGIASSIDPASKAAFADRTPLYIPLACGCAKGSYQAPTTKVVTAGEIMYSIANNTFEGLTTYQAIQAANPNVVPEMMQIGQHLKIPLRCACPSAAQLAAGSKFLLSYAVFPEETLSVISGKFKVPVEQLQAANNDVSPSNVTAFSTLLVPLSALVSLTGSNSTPPGVPGPASAPPPRSSASMASPAHMVYLVTFLAVQSLFF